MDTVTPKIILWKLLTKALTHVNLVLENELKDLTHKKGERQMTNLILRKEKTNPKESKLDLHSYEQEEAMITFEHFDCCEVI